MNNTRQTILSALLIALLTLACWSIATLPATVTPVPSATASPSATITHTDTPSVTPSTTASATKTPTPTPTNTPSHTPTPSATATHTATPTSSATSTHAPTLTPSATRTPADPTPTREIVIATFTPAVLVLAQDTRAYRSAMVSADYILLPKGTLYEVWDSTTNNGWLGIAIPVTEYLYLTYWIPDTRTPTK